MFNSEIINGILFFITGACFGSFACCYSYRYINKLPFISERSKCDYCGHELTFKDLIPIFSYLINKGRCRYCKRVINVAYIIVELITSIIFVLFYFKYSISLELVQYLIMICVLITITLIDYKLYIIPDELVIVGVIIRFLFLLLTRKRLIITTSINGLLVFVFMNIFVMIMNKVFKQESMGGGDVKLFSMLSLFLPITDFFYLVFMSCLFGFLYILIKKDRLIPFGPLICISFVIMMVI